MGGTSILAGLKGKSNKNNNTYPHKSKCLTSCNSDCSQSQVVYQVVCGICEIEHTNSGSAQCQPDPNVQPQMDTRQSSDEPNSGQAEVNSTDGSQLNPATRKSKIGDLRIKQAKAQYIGTTGRTQHARLVEHQKALVSGNTKNPLFKHMKNKHQQ